MQIRGRHGGIYFKRDNSGQHIQKMPRVVRYTRSGVQGENVGNYSECGLVWAGVVALGLWVLWVAFAAAHWWMTKDKRRIKLTGWNWFVHYNMKRLADGLPPMLEPPDF